MTVHSFDGSPRFNRMDLDDSDHVHIRWYPGFCPYEPGNDVMILDS